jgi:hypothetical protein
MRAVCEYTISAGSSAILAAKARFQYGRRNRRPASHDNQINATPHSTEGKRNAHSDSPNNCTEPAMRYSWVMPRG